jgi:hypothetical protein
VCFALALWNGRDPILKERLFGLTGPEGNHGEDVKELHYFLDYVFVEYAKADPDDILIRITCANRGAAPATLHLLPTLCDVEGISCSGAGHTLPLAGQVLTAMQFLGLTQPGGGGADRGGLHQPLTSLTS